MKRRFTTLSVFLPIFAVNSVPCWGRMLQRGHRGIGFPLGLLQAASQGVPICSHGPDAYRRAGMLIALHNVHFMCKALQRAREAVMANAL